LLNQEDLIQSLVEEVKFRKNGNTTQAKAREQLMILAESHLRRDSLRQNRKDKEPLYIRTQEDEKKLQ
jgi:hypothetical protein